MAKSLVHPVFGELRWEDAYSWWFAQIRVESYGLLDVIVDPGDDDPSAFLERASRLFVRALTAERAIRQQAVENKIAELYEVCSEEDEPELTTEELRDQLELTFVRVDTGDSVSLGYYLGDVFGGQGVRVTTDEGLALTSVNLG